MVEPRNKSFIESVEEFQEEAFDALELDESLRSLIREPKRIVEVNFPVRMRDGEVRAFRGYRVLHSDVLGPGKGGIRYAPYVNLDEVSALATIMTWKNSLFSLPYGGAKGGVLVNVKDLNEQELENLTRSYTRAIAPFIGLNRDIPAPDMYTNEQIMAWIVDEYSRVVREFVPGVVTGKPLSFYGVAGRREATGLGAFYVFDEFVQRNKLDKSKLKIAVQGFGNAGYYFAKFAQEHGYKIVAVADSSATIYSEKGIDVEKSYKHKKELGKFAVCSSKELCDFASEPYEVLDPEQVLELDVDVVVPAALENQIHERNMKNIKAKYVLEVANGAITYDAHKYLIDQDVVVLPDLLVNGGGVVVSYFEWVQNRMMHAFTKEEVYAKLRTKMHAAYDDVLKISKDYGTNDLRLSAYIYAVKRVVDVLRYRV